MLERLEKARQDAELKTAKMVQETFFPKQPAAQDRFRLSAFFQPASECGGDWWGRYSLSPQHELVCIADATGHGVSAALVTAMVFAATSIMARRFQEAQKGHYSPAILLNELNKTLCETSSSMLTMTFVAVVFDFEAGQMYFSNAGHPFPSLVRKGDTDKKEFLRSSNNPLGIDLNSQFVDAAPMPILAGDRVVFYTDGLLECRNKGDEQWGRRRFFKSLKDHASSTLDGFKDGLLHDAYQHFDGQPADDDVTVVVTEISDSYQSPAALPPPLEEAG
jgi:serine phosphatase RsbU (regulator of sigma subunit)